MGKKVPPTSKFMYFITAIVVVTLPTIIGIALIVGGFSFTNNDGVDLFLGLFLAFIPSALLFFVYPFSKRAKILMLASMVVICIFEVWAFFVFLDVLGSLG